MAKLQEVSQSIKKLRQDKENPEKAFEEILSLYFNEVKDKYPISEISSNSFLTGDILFAFYKLDRYEEGYRFMSEDLQYEITRHTSPFVISFFGWTLLRMLKNISAGGEQLFSNEPVESTLDVIPEVKPPMVEKLYSTTEKLLKLINLTEDRDYSLYAKLFFAVIKSETGNASPDWNFVLNFLDGFDSRSFREQPEIIKIKTGRDAGREKELSSDRESFVIVKQKAMFELGKFEEVRDFSQNVLETLTKFHFSNEFFFKRYIALSELELGNVEESAKIYKQILALRKEWFAQKEYANILFKLGDSDSALKYAIDSALSQGDLLSKTSLFYLIGMILLKMEKPDLAKKHIVLDYALRKEKGSNIPAYLRQAMNENGYLEEENLVLLELIRELRKYWESTLKQGKIKKILVDKKIGWIRSDDGEYFFRFSNFKGEPKSIREGLSVLFSWDAGWDKAKNTETKDAGYVTSERK